MKGVFFCLVCTSRKTINICELKVDVQEGALIFREIIDNECVSFIQFMFSSSVVYGHSPL